MGRGVAQLLEVPRQYLLYLLFIFGAGFEMARLHFSSPSFGEVKEEVLLVSPIRKADGRDQLAKITKTMPFLALFVSENYPSDSVFSGTKRNKNDQLVPLGSIRYRTYT